MGNSTKWTKEQLEVIQSESDNLLVSASAGSGKTAVLTERIIKKIIDGNMDISRLLVVTFGKAAAEELRTRISNAIRSRLAEQPDSVHLQQQARYIANAPIMTINSFCLKIIKENSGLLGLTPNVKTVTDIERQFLLEDVISAVYDGFVEKIPGFGGIEDLGLLVECFTPSGSTFEEEIKTIYNKVLSPRNLEKSVQMYEDAENNGFEKSAFGGYVIDYVKNISDYYLAVFSSACEYCRQDKVLEEKVLPGFSDCKKYCEDISFACEKNDYERLLDLVNREYSFMTKKVPPEYKGDPSIEAFFDERKKFKELLNVKGTKEKSDPGMLKNIVRPLDVQNQYAGKMKTIVSDLKTFIEKVEEEYTKLKRSRDLVDYDDQLRLAYGLLCDNGKPTEIAKKAARAYDEVYIDEYQDVDDLQDEIFRMFLKCGCRRFMVGDMKQSIYGFRGSNPEIFASYLDGARDGTDVLYLNKNFRSEKRILDFVNNSSGKMFRLAKTSVPYTDNDDLVCSRDEEGGKVEIISFVKEGTVSAEKEAASVAETIRGMIGSGEYKPSEISILVRDNKRGNKMVAALEGLGINTASNATESLFESPEVLLMLCILNVIDNPSNDICLAGMLKSPIFGFSLDELITIRQSEAGGSLFDAVVKYTEKNGFEKGRLFLERLSSWQEYSRQRVDALLWFLYCDTGIFGMIGGNAAEKRSKLLYLHKTAREFEGSNFKGLYNFIVYVNDLVESDKKIETPMGMTSKNAVLVTTIHKSKGLQYPVVFIPFSGKNKSPGKSPADGDFAYEEKFGFAPVSVPAGIGKKIETFPAKALALKKKLYEREEEMRVLYVALTRAIKELYITSAGHDCAAERSLGRNLTANGYSREMFFGREGGYLDWIAMSCGEGLNVTLCPITEPVSRQDGENEEITEKKISGNAVLLAEEYKKRIEYDYSSDNVPIPTKISVSNLYPDILDEKSEEEIAADEAVLATPRFISGEHAGADEKGTATHVFMQFCSFDNIRKNGIENEINRLVGENYIDEKTASLILVSKVKWFSQTSLFRELCNAEFIKREMRFTILRDASDFSRDGGRKKKLEGKRVLVQGVIDCVYRRPDGSLCVLDYKTDRKPSGMSDGDFAEVLRTRHGRQLGYYSDAVCDIMGERPEHTVIYSFALGREVEL